MRLTQILPKDTVIESVQQLSIRTYLSESLYNIPEMQAHWKRIDEGFVTGYEKYLAEVALTPDQIQGIFKQASGGAGAAPKDPGKLAALMDKILPSSQAANLEKSLPEPDSGPVDGFENKAGAAVQNLQGVDGGTKQSLMQLIKAGVKKPETQQLILAAVGAGLGGLISKVGPFLSMIPGGGPVVAAITGAVVAGGVAVLAAKLRGEDWKSAFKGAIKPALMGGAAAVVGNLVTTGISSMLSGGTPQGSPESDYVKDMKAQGKDPNDPDGSLRAGLKGNTFDNDPEVQAHRAEVAAMQADAGQLPTTTASNPDGSITQRGLGTLRGGVPDGATATDDAGSYVLNKTNPDGSSSQTVRQNADPADPRVRASIDAKQDYYKNDPQGRAEFAKIMKGTKGIDDSVIRTGKKLSEGRVYLVINRICQHQLNEGPLDAIKKMFGKSKEAPGVTADALNAAWTQAGSPTDSDEIAAILKQAGVGDDVVGKVYTDLKIPAPGAGAAQDTSAVEKLIAQMTAKDKQRLAKYITKQLGTA